jgi:predicted DsbA family dithiol-disulfide isomerase
VELIWMPFELRPYPTRTLRPEDDYLQNAWRNSVYPLAARKGIDIRLPDVSPQPYTRLAFEGLEFAKSHALGNEYNSAVMRAFFQRSEDIGDPTVLTHIASDVGLDGTLFQQTLRNRTYAPEVEKLLRHAYEDVRVTGVPLFVIGKRQMHGLQSRQSLEAAIDQELSQDR